MLIRSYVLEDAILTSEGFTGDFNEDVNFYMQDAVELLSDEINSTLYVKVSQTHHFLIYFNRKQVAFFKYSKEALFVVSKYLIEH